MHAVVQDAVREYVDSRAHRALVAASIDRMVAGNADILRELADR